MTSSSAHRPLGAARRLSRTGLWGFGLALLVVHCRSYELEALEFSPPNDDGGAKSSSSSEGGEPPGGGGGHVGNKTQDAGASGAPREGRAGEGNGAEGGDGGEPSASGSSGTHAGAEGGAGGTGATPGTDAGNGGESGTGGVTPLPPPGVMGAVRILVGGVPRCGGTLVSNAWLLTADQCVPAETDLETIQIGFGSDSTNFEQLRGVAEIVRFPGNDGTPENRGRDLLLVGVDAPFVIDGTSTRYHRSVLPKDAAATLTELRCYGWDLRPHPESDTTRLHAASFAGVALDVGVTEGGRPMGDRVWWLNVAEETDDGLLPMPDDMGTGCFRTDGATTFLSTVHSGNPALRRNGEPNDRREAYSQVLSEAPIREWLSRSLFEVSVEQLDLAGDAGICSLAPGTFELFARRHDGALGFWRFSGAFVEEPSLAPPAGVVFSTFRPGAFCAPSGAIELFVVDVDGAAWQRTRAADGASWSVAWERLYDATTKITSGMAVVGAVSHHFHVFAKGEDDELRHAEFDGDWTGKWENRGGVLMGTPAARMGQENRIDVFSRGVEGHIFQLWSANGDWHGWSHLGGGPVTSDPAVTTWAPDHLDVLARNAAGTLLRATYESLWSPAQDVGLPVPTGNFVAVSTEVGQIEALVTDIGSVWRARWPRLPVSGD